MYNLIQIVDNDERAGIVYNELIWNSLQGMFLLPLPKYPGRQVSIGSHQSRFVNQAIIIFKKYGDCCYLGTLISRPVAILGQCLYGTYTAICYYKVFFGGSLANARSPLESLEYYTHFLKMRILKIKLGNYIYVLCHSLGGLLT